MSPTNPQGGVVLNATENPPQCPVFTLSASINGIAPTGLISNTVADINIYATPSVMRRGKQQYHLRVSAVSLQLQWKGDQNWIPDVFFRPTTIQAQNQFPIILTDQPSLFPISLKKPQTGQGGMKSIIITWKHGLLTPKCAHTLTLKIQT